LCRLARHVTVGNDVLAEFARAHTRDVSIVPSTIDTDLYRVAARAPNPRLVVGWTGSSSTAAYLQALREPLLALRRSVDFELRVIGAQVDMAGLDVHCYPWRPETEVDDLRSLDVGLMPLRDDPWARGKCAMKALQYMALGIPPVVSPVGVNRAIVGDGANGFHASSDAEWVEKLATLLRAPDLRVRLGEAARRTVDLGYSARVQAPRLARILRETALTRLS
jgi:glycosyltransferase involved in cell wall biosynthesis